MNYMKIKPVDIADGIGVRVGLYVSGCSRHCEGCHNREAWAFDAGKLFDDEAMEELLDLLEPDYIDGISILGGEPLDKGNAETVLGIIDNIREVMPSKTIWLYTGYTLDADEKDADWDKDGLLAKIFLMCDVVVDGAYEKDKRNLSLRFRGSSNQRIIDVQRTIKAGCEKMVLWEEGVKA